MQEETRNAKAAVRATPLYYMRYNFCRVHQTLRVTQAMEAGLTDHVWTIEEMLIRFGGKRKGPTAGRSTVLKGQCYKPLRAQD